MTESQEQHEQWHHVVERIGELMTEVFGEGNEPMTVFGAQFPPKGDGEPNVLLASNMPICVVADAIEDMFVKAEQEHDRIHEEAAAASGNVTENIADPESVPDQVREAAEAFAKSLGMQVSDIVFMEVADTSDLDALPETEEPFVADLLHKAFNPESKASE